jgi:hypothetical protein
MTNPLPINLNNKLIDILLFVNNFFLYLSLF